MKQTRPPSIQWRIRRSVLVLACSLAAAGGAAVWVASFSAEDHVLEEIAEDVARAAATGEEDDLGRVLRVTGVDQLEGELAEFAAANADGSYELEGRGEETRIVLTTNSEGERIAVIAQLKRELSNANLALWITAAFLVALGISTWVADRSARAAVEPVERLASTLSDAKLPPKGFAASFGDDEVGVLARRFEATLVMMESAVEGERIFLRDASHELRTPLAVLTTTAELLERSGEERTPADQKRFARLSRAAYRMRAAVDSLLWLAREEGREVQPYDLDLEEELKRLVDAAREDLSPVISLTLRVDGGDLPPGRASLWGVAVSNLLANAVRHTVDGSIQIEVSRRAIRVKDTGEGMSDELLERVGQPWNVGERGEWGLGLAIVRRVAERHGWRLRLESEPGRGTEAILGPEDAVDGASAAS